MPDAHCTRGPVCNEKKAHTSIQGSGGDPTFPAQWLYGLLRALPGDRLSNAHIFCCGGRRRLILSRSCFGGSDPWKLNWDDLAIVAWKKGGLVACCPGSTALCVHSTSCREAIGRGPVHAFSAQRPGERCGDGEPCGLADG